MADTESAHFIIDGDKVDELRVGAIDIFLCLQDKEGVFYGVMEKVL